MKTRRSVPVLVVILLAFLSFSKTLESQTLQTIAFDNWAKAAPLSSFLTFEGFTQLNSSADHQPEDIRKVRFADGNIVTLEGQENSVIYLYNEKTGDFIRQIGRPTESANPEDGYYGLMDIALLPQKNTLRALSTGQHAFIDYSLDGRFISAIPNGVFGDGIAFTSDGRTVVYNEQNSTDASGCNYLLMFDSTGHILGKYLPYDKVIDNRSYDFTGYLAGSGPNIWLNPPFCDTIFQITGNRVQPRFVVNFNGLGEAASPSFSRSLEVENNLEEGFFQSGHFVIFPYVAASYFRFGFYDTDRGLFLSASKTAAKDPLYPLFKSGKLFYKSDDTFCLVVSAGYLQSLVADNKLNKAFFQKNVPGFLDRMQQSGAKGNDKVLLYFSFKQGAHFKAG